MRMMKNLKEKKRLRASTLTLIKNLAQNIY